MKKEAKYEGWFLVEEDKVLVMECPCGSKDIRFSFEPYPTGNTAQKLLWRIGYIGDTKRDYVQCLVCGNVSFLKRDNNG